MKQYCQQQNLDDSNNQNAQNIESIIESASIQPKQHNFPRAVKYAALTGMAALTFLTAYGCKQSAQTTTTQPTIETTTTQTTTPTTTTTIPGLENIMSKAQIKTTIEDILSSDLSSQKPVTDYTRAVWQKAEDVNKSVYYYLTGRTFEQDNFTVRIFTLDEKFIPNFPPPLQNPDGTPDVAGTANYLSSDDLIEIFTLGNPTGSNTDRYNSARTFLMILANETGNAMDMRLRSRGDFMYTRTRAAGASIFVDVQADLTYWEAAKMAYQGAYFRFLEDEIGINLSVADTAQNRETIKEGVDYERTGNITGNGWYLMWTILLENQGLKSELDQNKKLSSASCLKLHDIILKELMTNSNYAGRVKTALADQSPEQAIASYIYKNLAPSGAGITNIAVNDTFELFGP